VTEQRPSLGALRGSCSARRVLLVLVRETRMPALYPHLCVAGYSSAKDQFSLRAPPVCSRREEQPEYEEEE